MSLSSFSRPALRAIFDIVVYYVAGHKEIGVFKTKGTFIKDNFKKLCEDNVDFVKAISSNTNNLLETSRRFAIWGKIMKKVDRSIKIPKNLLAYYQQSS